MQTIKPFLFYLQKFIDISEEEFSTIIVPVCSIKHFRKKEILTKAGEVESNFYFIITGLIRKYYKRSNQEINTQISTEGHLIHSQESFHSRQTSEYYVQAIEASTVVSISYEDLEALYASSGKMEHLGRLVVTHTMVIKDRWQMQMIKWTPRERFVNFVTKNAELMNRVPQKYLASYLNIKPETFSRFKRLLRDQGKS